MSVKSQHKVTIPHEAVELLVNSSNELTVTGPEHQMTTISVDELDTSAHTVMFSTMETTASAAIALPTTWGQKRGVLVVLAKSRETLRYYGSDVAAKGGNINSAPIWYRSRRPILSMTVRGVLAVLQTATELIVLMSDAVTCREVAIHPIVSSEKIASKGNAVVVKAALSEMSRGSATYIVATMSSSPNAKNIDITAFTITSASISLVATQSVAKTALAVAHLTINPESGIVSVPVFNDATRSSVGIVLLNALETPSTPDEPAKVLSIDQSIKKVLAIAALPSKRWMFISPVTGEDDANAHITVVTHDGSVIASENILLGSNHNSSTNKIEKRLVVTVVPSTGRVIVLNGHEVNIIKITFSKTLQAVEGGETALGKHQKPVTSLAAAFRLAKYNKNVVPIETAPSSSSRLLDWSALIDASAFDVYAILDKVEESDNDIAEAVAEGLLNLNDLPDLASTALSQLPFADWHRAARKVKNIHNTLKIAHLIFVAGLKRGAIGVCSIVARAFDALYPRTGEDETSAHLAYEMRHCLQQISLWTNEQMGKQIGVVTVHCTGKSPAIKQAMFIPHQPFSVSVKRHADIEKTIYTTFNPTEPRAKKQ